MLGERLTVLLGNHDIAYLEAVRRREGGGPPTSRRYRCTGYTDERAAVIAEALGEEFLRECRLFQYVNGHLVSHAGLAGRFRYPELPLDEALKALDADCRQALENVSAEGSPLLEAGAIRGGRSSVGGITWLDFDHEFTDAEIGPPQICGHTVYPRGDPRERVRFKGRSCCLDGHQTCYGRLHQEGRVEFRVF